MNLQGKTALVTGSTSGIGLGIAQTLANAGAQVILNGFGDVDAAINAVSRMGKTPGYHEADLSDESQIINMMAYARREFGGVDILVNNAGISMSPRLNLSCRKMERHYRYQSLFCLSHHASGTARNAHS